MFFAVISLLSCKDFRVQVGFLDKLKNIVQMGSGIGTRTGIETHQNIKTLPYFSIRNQVF